MPQTLLDLAGGAPLKALAMDNPEILGQRRAALQAFLGLVQDRTDPVKLADQWTKYDIKRLMEWLTGWVIDMLRLQVSVHPTPALQQGRKTDFAASGGAVKLPSCCNDFWVRFMKCAI